MKRATTISSKIAAIYVVVGASWILFSDELLVQFVHDTDYFKQLSIYKGWLYVVATGLLLYVLVRRQMGLIVGSEIEVLARNRQLAITEEELRRQIEEHKKTENELNAANERLKTLFNASPLSIIALDAQGIVTKWNRAAELLFGWKAQEIKGKSYPLVPEGDPAGRRHFLEKTLHGEVQRDIQVRRLKKTGELVDVSLSTAPIYGDGGSIDGIIVLIADTTEKLQAEESLRKNEKLLRTVLETLPVGVWIISDSGKTVQGNPAGKAIWGGEWLVGMEEYGIFKGWWADSGKRIEPGEWAAARAILKGEVSLNEVIDIETFDGRRKTILSSTVPLRNQDDEIDGAIVVNQDISEQKKAEEDVRQLNVELEERVLERTTQLEAANKELEAFSFSVSHDLRAPLRHIDGFSQVLLEDYGDSLDQGGRDHLMRLRRASQRLSQLVDDLLELSRVTRGELERQQIDLSGMVQSVFHDLQQAQPERRVALRVAAHVTANGDTRLLRVVMENLIGNAWKYTAKKDQARIEFDSYSDRGEIIYYLRDDGAGFDMHYADKLFAPFQRLHRADEFEGTGVGLATVQRIIFRHGGRIWAEGAPGEGATFYFTLSGTNG